MTPDRISVTVRVRKPWIYGFALLRFLGREVPDWIARRAVVVDDPKLVRRTGPTSTAQAEGGDS